MEANYISYSGNDGSGDDFKDSIEQESLLINETEVEMLYKKDQSMLNHYLFQDSSLQ